MIMLAFTPQSIHLARLQIKYCWAAASSSFKIQQRYLSFADSVLPRRLDEVFIELEE